jgi:hypothetical protein
MSDNLDLLRARLIQDDLDDLSAADIEAIVDCYWEEFKPLAVRYLDERRWNDGNDVYMEAVERGYVRRPRDPSW